MSRCILALDQGTTSSRAIAFGEQAQVLSVAQREFPQIYPSPGHVEHDPEAIWESQLATAKQALHQAGCSATKVAAIGVTNQRETTVLWDRQTGKPVSNAIVWQSRITADICARHKANGEEDVVRQKTGLVLDPYFSGTKIEYLLAQSPDLRARAERGDILFGTIDSFLFWRLSGGKLHITDASNASRTLLFNLQTGDWDDELLKLFGVPRAMLPQVRASSEVYGETDSSLFGRPIPLAGCAGDQQAATFGQTCFAPGSAKNTYGTGCFLLLNTGSTPVHSQHGLLTTVAWKIGDVTTYALEGAVFVAGAAVQWLRDGLNVITSAGETEALAASLTQNDGVYLVPAFVGLGAPYWDPLARGILVGLTRGTSRAHLARAALEAMAYQTADVLQAMQQDLAAQPQGGSSALTVLQVDGGATANSWLMQFQADLLGLPVRRPVVQETTALGAAYLAGLAVGVWQNQDELRKHWALDREFRPEIAAESRASLYAGWRRAVERSRGWAVEG